MHSRVIQHIRTNSKAEFNRLNDDILKMFFEWTGEITATILNLLLFIEKNRTKKTIELKSRLGDETYNWIIKNGR